MTTIALARPTCRWDPHRAKSFERVSQDLGLRNDRDEMPDPLVKTVRTFSGPGPEPTYVWSERVFRWMTEQDAEWCFQVQDDVLLCPDFWPVLKAALSALPDSAEIVTLFTLIPQASELADQGCNWATTSDWVTGPFWGARTKFMREQVWPFRQERLRKGWQDNINGRNGNSLNEDTLVGFVAAATGRRVWCPVPALVDHDTSMESVASPGRAPHRFDKASYNWRAWSRHTKSDVAILKDPDYWKPRNTAGDLKDPAVHFGCVYSFTYHTMLRWVRDDGGDFGGMTWAERADAIRDDHVAVEQTQPTRPQTMQRPPSGLPTMRRVE